MDSSRIAVTVRWLAAVGVGAAGVGLLARVLGQGGDWIIVFAKSLYGIAGMLTAVLLVSPELVGWAVTPIHRMLDKIIMPSETEIPPADFRLARHYAKSLRYDDACEEYAKIIQYHPDAINAYLEGIRAAKLGGDSATAKTFYQGARRYMRSSDERWLLKNVYAARHSISESVEATAP